MREKYYFSFNFQKIINFLMFFINFKRFFIKLYFLEKLLKN